MSLLRLAKLVVATTVCFSCPQLACSTDSSSPGPAEAAARKDGVSGSGDHSDAGTSVSAPPDAHQGSSDPRDASDAPSAMADANPSVAPDAPAGDADSGEAGWVVDGECPAAIPYGSCDAIGLTCDYGYDPVECGGVTMVCRRGHWEELYHTDPHTDCVQPDAGADADAAEASANGGAEDAGDAGDTSG